MTTEKEDEAVDALKLLSEVGSKAFITVNSYGPAKRPEVIAKFSDLESAQSFYRALINCGEVIRQSGRLNNGGQE